MNKDTIQLLLTEKQAMLATATKVVEDIAREIAALKVLLESENSRSDLYTALFKHANTVASSDADSSAAIRQDRDSQAAVRAERTASDESSITPTKTGRNPKGATEAAIADALSDGLEHDIDFIMKNVNARLPNPLPRGGIRTALMFAKESGVVVSSKPGHFQKAIKGESPADFTATNSEGEAFNLQPSPDQGR